MRSATRDRSVGRRVLRQRGMTLIEILVVVAILGIVANILVPAMLTHIVKARAAHLISEFKLIETAVHSYHTDTGQGPRPWFSTREHPDLAPYLRNQITYSQPGLGLLKIFLRYPQTSSLGFQSGYLLYSYRPSPLVQMVEDKFEGRVVSLWPGRLIILVIEA